MQTITVPQTIVSMLQASGRISQAGGMQNLQGMLGGDAFAQLLGQLMGQTVCTQTQIQDAEKQGTQMAADMFSQLFPGMLSGSVDLESIMSQVQQMNGQIDMTQGEAGQTPLQTLLSAMDAENPTKSAELFQKLTALNQSDTENRADMEVISAVQTQGKTAGETAENLFGGENEFRNSVLTAQKLLNRENSQKMQTDEPKRIDVEQLQNDVDSGRFSTAMNVDKVMDKVPDVQNVMAQVKTGIKENLTLGKNEFVVKLKPEGLGEITVKMVEADSKISLSIMTSSPQVAKLINGELAGLRETLRPFNADVHEVVSQADASYSAAQNGQFTQQDTARQFQQFSQPHFQSMPLNFNEDDFDETILDQSMAPVSELDTYI